MNSDRQAGQQIIDVITQRLVTPKMAKDQITNIPILVSMVMGLWMLIPPQFRTKPYLILAVVVISIAWARWLYVMWRRRVPTNESGSAQMQTWTQFNTLIYYLARVTWFFPFSLGWLAVSLSIFSSLQAKLVQALLIIGYGVATITLSTKRHWLLEISVVGIQNRIWKRLRARIMSIGLGLVGIGVALGTAISRLDSGNVDLWIMGVLSSVLALMTLVQGFLELFIVRVFFAKGVWHRE